MSGQKAVDYQWIKKALPICTTLQQKIISAILDSGDIRQAAKNLGMSEAAVQQTFYRVRRKLLRSDEPKQQKSDAELLLRRSGINPRWLAERKKELIESEKPSMAALKAINDCEEVFGLKEPTGAGIQIDTGPKIIINLGSGFDALKKGGMQQGDGEEYPTIASGASITHARVESDSNIAKTSDDGLSGQPDAKSGLSVNSRTQ